MNGGLGHESPNLTRKTTSPKPKSPIRRVQAATCLKILARAIEEPLRQIVANAGVDAAVVLHGVRDGKGTFGYNAATGEYSDMVEHAEIVLPASAQAPVKANPESILEQSVPLRQSAFLSGKAKFTGEWHLYKPNHA